MEALTALRNSFPSKGSVELGTTFTCSAKVSTEWVWTPMAAIDLAKMITTQKAHDELVIRIADENVRSYLLFDASKNEYQFKMFALSNAEQSAEVFFPESELVASLEPIFPTLKGAFTGTPEQQRYVPPPGAFYSDAAQSTLPKTLTSSSDMIVPGVRAPTPVIAEPAAPAPVIAEPAAPAPIVLPPPLPPVTSTTLPSDMTSSTENVVPAVPATAAIPPSLPAEPPSAALPASLTPAVGRIAPGVRLPPIPQTLRARSSATDNIVPGVSSQQRPLTGTIAPGVRTRRGGRRLRTYKKKHNKRSSYRQRRNGKAL